MSAILEYAKKVSDKILEKNAGLRDFLFTEFADRVVKDGGRELIRKTPSLMGSITQALPALGAATVSGVAIYNWLRNDTKRRNVFEAIASDPEFSSIDRKQLLDWFNTIHTYAPSVTQDKVSCKEFIRQFVMFGKVDMQSIKMLSDIEKNVSGAHKDHITLPKWF